MGGWLAGWVAGEMENKAIFQLEVGVKVEVEVGAWQKAATTTTNVQNQIYIQTNRLADSWATH